MLRHSLMIFIILVETIQNVYTVSGSESFNPSSTNLGTAQLDTSNLLGNRQSPEDKIIEKRGLPFNEGEINSSPVAERELEDDEYPPWRRTNHTESESHEYQKAFNWGSKHSVYTSPTEVRPRQSYSAPPSPKWGQRKDIFGTGKLHWLEEKKQIAKSDSDRGVGHRGRLSHMIGGDYHSGRNGEVTHRRMSVLNGEGMSNERLGEVNSDYVGHGMKYYDGNPTGYWSPNFYRPEKGVVINFNTECPAPNRQGKQMVHKFIITPKSQVGAVPEISHFQIPDTAFIQAHESAPLYYM